MYNKHSREMPSFAPSEVLVYLRKSQSDDPTMTSEEVLQKHEFILDNWATEHLGAVVPEENKFREVVSGENITSRPKFQAVLRLIESPKIKALLVVEPQRISRGDLEDMGRIIKLLRYTNTLVITPPRLYDLGDEDDRDIFERELKRGNEFLEYYKRIQARGIRSAVEAGDFVGSTVPYGYDKITVKIDGRRHFTLKANEEKAEVVRMIFRQFNEGVAVYEITQRLRKLGICSPRGGAVWEPTTVKNILKNPHYIGKVAWFRVRTQKVVEDGEVLTKRSYKAEEPLICEGRHSAIIDEKTFFTAQERLGNTPRIKHGKELVNRYASLLYCRTCGLAMCFSNRKTPLFIHHRPTTCEHTRAIRLAELDKRIGTILSAQIEDFELRIKNGAEEEAERHEELIKSLKARLEKIDKQELSQWEMQSDPDKSKRMPPEIFAKLNAKLRDEREAVKKALSKAQQSEVGKIDYLSKKARFSEALGALNDPNATAQQKNEFLKTCISRIDYARDEAGNVVLDVKLKI